MLRGQRNFAASIASIVMDSSEFSLLGTPVKDPAAN